MSYNPQRNDDSLSELISEICEFNQIGKHLLASKDDFREYLLWSSKTTQISPRSYYLFLEKHNDEFCDEIKSHNQHFLSKARNKKRPLDYCVNRGWLMEELGDEIKACNEPLLTEMGGKKPLLDNCRNLASEDGRLVNNILGKEKLLYEALEELDKRFAQIGVKPFELNVIGGFALLLDTIRFSDCVDYEGKGLPDDIRTVIDEVGAAYKLGRGWINDNIHSAGFTLEDLEMFIGALNFKHVCDLEVIRVKAIDAQELLRMKVVAIDSSCMGFSQGEFRRGVSRDVSNANDKPRVELIYVGKLISAEDLKDTKLLMEQLGYTYQDMVNECYDYVCDSDTFMLIDYYLRFNSLEAFSSYEGTKFVIDNKAQLRYLQ